MAEFMADETGVEIINDSDVANDEVFEALSIQHPEVASLVRWTRDTASPSARHGSMFERDRYVTPRRWTDKVKTARTAALYDDVVSNAIETTEALAFRKIGIDTETEEETDIWNQLAEDLDLDSRLREMWRELFVVGQVTCAVWWGTKSYRVRGRTTKGVKRKKTYENLRVPVGMTVLDPLKVVPVGNLLFNQEKLAYVADDGEMDIIQAHIEGRRDDDPIIRQLMIGKYEPDSVEREMLSEDGIAASRLFLMNPANVWRHTGTRSQYERFAPVRMEGVFELLDLKHQLRSMDRAHLIGGPLRVDQRVVTPDGWREIGTLQTGDLVYGPNGKPRQVIGVFPQGYLSMYRVTFTDGASVVCDDSHPWTVFNRDRQERTITLAEIMREGLFTTNGEGKRLHRHRIPITEPVELPEAELPIDPYLMGFFPDKFIPDEYLWASVEQRWALLQGLLDSDGSVSGVGAAEFSTNSEKLADGVVQLAQSLGGVGTIYKGSDHLRVHVALHQKEAPFRLQRKAAAWRPRERPYVRAITSIERLPDAPAVCIKVGGGTDGLFLTEGHLVTHNTNFLVLVKKGTDERPANQREVQALQAQVRTLARVPVIVGDHRLDIEIITPKNDNTLRPDRYNGIDARITSRLYQVMMTGSFSAGAQADDSLKLAKFIARSLESRRHMMKRAVEKNLLLPTYRKNTEFDEKPTLQFHPKRIALDFDGVFAQYLMDLRDRGDLSRETILEEVDYNQYTEFRRRQVEEERYDDVFHRGVINPWGGGTDEDPDSPVEGPAAPRAGGRRRGGNRNGGGAAPGTGQGQAPDNPTRTSDGTNRREES